jgi:hypothetical protein
MKSTAKVRVARPAKVRVARPYKTAKDDKPDKPDRIANEPYDNAVDPDKTKRRATKHERAELKSRNREIRNAQGAVLTNSDRIFVSGPYDISMEGRLYTFHIETREKDRLIVYRLHRAGYHRKKLTGTWGSPEFEDSHSESLGDATADEGLLRQTRSIPSDRFAGKN